MAWLGASTTDDRGRMVPVPLPGSTRAPSSRFKGDPELGAVMVRLAESIQMSRGVVVRRLLLVPFVVAAMVVVQVFMFRFTGTPPWVWLVGLFLMMMVFATLMIRVRQRGHTRRIVATLLYMGRCPSCAYSPAGVPVQPDGCVICPECAAAWKASRLNFSAAPDQLREVFRTERGETVVGSRLAAWRRSPTIVDARDRAVPLLGSRSGVGDGVGNERLALARRAAFRRTLWLRVGGCVLVLGWIGLIILPQVLHVARRGVGGMAGLHMLMLVVFVPFGALLIWRIAAGRSRLTSRRFARTLLEHGLCPSCGGDLLGAEVEADGCSVCSRCRAVWVPGRARVQGAAGLEAATHGAG